MNTLTNIIAMAQCLLFAAFLVSFVYLVVNLINESLTLKTK